MDAALGASCAIFIEDLSRTALHAAVAAGACGSGLGSVGLGSVVGRLCELNRALLFWSGHLDESNNMRSMTLLEQRRTPAVSGSLDRIRFVVRFAHDPFGFSYWYLRLALSLYAGTRVPKNSA
jgi:hypothetical protein